MKKSSTLLTLLTSILFLSFHLPPHSEIYHVDLKASKIEWFAEKVTGKHNGSIQLNSGQIRNDHGKIGGTFEFNMLSILVSDMADATYKAKLEKHLKSADFFDAEKFPKSTFIITSMIPFNDSKKEFTHTIKGMLTIKDITQEISFPANMVMNATSIHCIGSAIVDRSKFNIQYGSKTFFPNIGDKMIMDEFILKFDIVAMK